MNRTTRRSRFAIPRPHGSDAASRPAPAPAVPPCGCVATDHVVQFYERDAFLIRTLSRFFVEGLTNDAGALLLATRPHRLALEEHLRGVGIDVAVLEQQGRYVAVDANAVAAAVVVGGQVQPAVFDREVASRVRHLTASRRRLCVFGEVVALLCADGHPDAAIEVELLWNNLAQQHAFSLFCAYPMSAFATPDASRAFLRVCRTHARVIPAESYRDDEPDERLREIAALQQKAAALEAESADRERAEEALRRRDDQLTTLIETAPVAIRWLAQDGTIVWANAAELELLGYPREEYIGRNMADFHVDHGATDDVLGRLVRGENLRNQEAWLKCRDGSTKPVLIDAGVFQDQGQFRHIQCFTRDISAERRAEQTSSLLAAIVTSSDDIIVSKNLDGIITSWNDSAERILGYRSEEVIGRHISLIIPPERQDEEPAILGRICRGERVEHFETIRRCKDGRLLELSLTISPVKDRHGRIIGASKVARDITERKRAERALKEARDELARANSELERRVDERTSSLREAVAQMEEFSYTVSHDLRAPLRGMQVYSQALLDDYGPKLDVQARRFLARIAENATRLDKMVLDVLTFSRLSREELKLEPVNLDRLVRDLLPQYPRMQPPDVIIDIEPLADVIGHEPSLTQAISNLLANAVKFVRPGVTPHIRIWTERRGEHVRLWVQDNGIGISPEFQDRLFRMFERLHPGLSYDGTGVGLAIVRKAMTRMNGEAGVESDGVHGSRFWLQLPRPGGCL